MAKEKYIIYINLAEVKVRIETDCEFENEKLHRLFEHHIIGEGECGLSADHTVSFIPIETDVNLPFDAQPHWRGKYVGCFPDSNDINWQRSAMTGLDYLFISKAICIVNDRDNHRTTVCIKCRRGRDGKLERPDFLDSIIIMVHVVASMHDRYTIHAGGVEIDGKAHVLLGHSGSGKSTLTTDLVKLGAGFMGDDIVFLYMKDGVPMVGSLMFEAKLFPEGEKKHKQIVNVINEYKGHGTFCAPLEAIHLVSQTKCGESWIEPQHPVECLTQLIQGTNDVHMQYDPHQWQRVCQTMAETAPYSIFHFGKRDRLSTKAFETNAQQD